jgi:hypothetical protein
MTVHLNEGITERIQAIALLLSSISAIHDSGLISHEKAFEICNICLDQVDILAKEGNVE